MPADFVMSRQMLGKILVARSGKVLRVGGPGDEPLPTAGAEGESLRLAVCDVEEEIWGVPRRVERGVDVERAAIDLPQKQVMSSGEKFTGWKHMGTLPAQQPADCTNMTGPPRAAHRRLTASRAAGVAEIRPAGGAH
jgi:hypothetical protein